MIPYNNTQWPQMHTTLCVIYFTSSMVNLSMGLGSISAQICHFLIILYMISYAYAIGCYIDYLIHGESTSMVMYVTMTTGWTMSIVAMTTGWTRSIASNHDSRLEYGDIVWDGSSEHGLGKSILELCASQHVLHSAQI